MTIREIAAIAGVSPAAVSLVLNNKKGVGKKKREHIKRVLEEHNYDPHENRGRMPRKRILFIKYRAHGMAVEENQGFVASMIDNVENECRRFSYKFLMQNCNEENIRDTFISASNDKPDGIIVLGTELEADKYDYLKLLNRPVVVIDNSMIGHDVDTIVMSNVKIAEMAVQHLYDLGHREIGYFKANIEVSNLMERHEGYIRRMKALGLKIPEPIKVPPSMNSSYAEMRKRLLESKYAPHGAYFADNDSIALGIVRAFQATGYEIPRDFSIIGVDDIPYSAVSMPSISTIRISRSALGILALDVLRKRIKYPDWPVMHMQVDGELVQRDSTQRAE